MNPNITDFDMAVVKDVRKLLLAILAVPAWPLEHAVQVAHESPATQEEDPDEAFKAQRVTRQVLRMFWNFRCGLDAAMPAEDRK